MSSRIGGARLVPLQSRNHTLLADEPAWRVFIEEVAAFLEPDRQAFAGDTHDRATEASPSPEDRVEAMLAAWRERCPIYLALLKPQSVALTTASSARAD